MGQCWEGYRSSPVWFIITFFNCLQFSWGVFNSKQPPFLVAFLKTFHLSSGHSWSTVGNQIMTRLKPETLRDEDVRGRGVGVSSICSTLNVTIMYDWDILTQFEEWRVKQGVGLSGPSGTWGPSWGPYTFNMNSSTWRSFIQWSWNSTKWQIKVFFFFIQGSMIWTNKDT